MWKTGAVPPTDANLNSISLEYSYEDVSRATRNFHQSHLLGRGAYGSVFKGILKDGTEVAIKMLSNPKESGFKEEVLVLSKFRHPNLVILMGFSRRDKERFLVYELLPGGDLCSRLQNDASFDWKSRLAACLDSALGLSHLHNASPKVFHRDIKTQNILLDRNGSAKIADFGLALLAQPRQGIRVEQCSGTLGYADPLYISSSVVTEKTEVYSFGMVLLEVLTGRPPAIQNPVNGQIQYVYINATQQSVMRMLQLQARWPIELASRLVKLALVCIDKVESNRPIFVHLVARLRDLISRSFQSPPQPLGAMNGFGPSSGLGVPFFPQPPQPHQQALPANPIVQNQQKLEEALLKMNAAAVAPPVRWNPFEIHDEVVPSVAPPKTPQVDTPTESAGETKPPVAERTGAVPPTGVLAIPQEAPAKLPAAIETRLSNSTGNRGGALDNFDEELRVMSAVKAQPEIEKGIESLFPPLTTYGETRTKPEIQRENHLKDVAKHLLIAGFSVDQIRGAIKRTSSVEGAVEWILEQDWQ